MVLLRRPTILAVVLWLASAGSSGAGTQAAPETPSSPASGNAIQRGLDWLVSEQLASGSWGSWFTLADTATVVEALAHAQRTGPAFESGAGWLSTQLALDSDELARQIQAPASAGGFDREPLIELLLGSRNPTADDTSDANFPEGGWGLVWGLQTDSLTTALALSALATTDVQGEVYGGMSAVGEELASFETRFHEWNIPADATTVRIEIAASSWDILLRMTAGSPPSPSDLFRVITPGTPTVIEFPAAGSFSAGVNFVSIELPDSRPTPAGYSITASYETAGVDTRAIAESLDYLRVAQRPDGGWRAQAANSSSLFRTLHALRALTAWPGYDFEGERVAAWSFVVDQQLADGSFGANGQPLSYMTGLALLALLEAGECPASAEVEAAVNALLAQQGVDGAWSREPYDTAVAIRALWGYDRDGDGILADGDCSGVAGDSPCAPGVTTGCDDNCVTHSNPGQASVVFDEYLLPSEDGLFLEWTQPQDVRFVVGDLNQLGSGYPVTVSASEGFATSIHVGDEQPAPGSGLFYLVKPSGDCSVGSWQSTSGAEPERDLYLP